MADANLSASSASSSAAAPVSSSPASSTVAAAASAAPVSSDCGTALDKSATPSAAPVSSANPSSAVDANSEPARIELKADVELIRSTAIILQQQQPLLPPVCDGPDSSNSRKPILPAKNAQPNRCSSCAIRVGLYGFSCKCGNLFCAKHRYSDLHNCSFDYSQTAINQLKKANPKVVAQKMLDTI